MAVTGARPFLWFDEQELEAAELYVSCFPDSRITSTSYYQEGAQKPAGTVLVVEFELFGQPFAALNGGPGFPHSEAISFQVMCDTQEELDRIWFTLIADGGAESQCGWCSDRFGVCWQVTPRRLGERLGDPDPAVSQAAWAAMMQMSRIDIAAIDAACDRARLGTS